MSNQLISKRKFHVIKPLALSACLMFAGLQVTLSHAASLSEVMGPLLEKAPRTEAAKADLGAAKGRVNEVTRRAWAPQIELNASTGWQRYEKPNAELFEVNNGRTHTLRLTQLISDFGRSSNSIEENQKVMDQVSAGLDAMKQGIALDAIQAYLSVQRSQKVLDYARSSEKNIAQQANIEDVMLDAGRGYVSNVLQAKAQLAGAQARRVRAEGAQRVAFYRVKAVFGEFTEGLTYGQQISAPLNLPASLEQATAEAEKNNLQIQIGQFRSSALNARMASVRAREYMPRLQFLLEARRATALDGVTDTVKDDRAQFQLNFPFNLGFAGTSAVNTAQQDITASVQRELETRNLVIEQVSISWSNLITAHSNKANLKNQTRLAEEFLNIAREERTVGKRTLLDVLSAETNLINAQSDLASTEFDVLSASYTLLQAIGRLDTQTVLNQLATAR
jgi:adhesin transport system outer membrane protein